MAENRYNVDDILREVKEKRDREERAAQPEKRATTTTEDLLRQLDAAQTGLSRAAGAASERPAPAKTAPQPVKKADRKSTRLNSSHKVQSRMPSSA